MEFNRVSVIGLGYIGLPTAAIFASRGVEVIGVDINQNTVDTINAGGVHIVEPDLDIVVNAAVKMGKLRATLTAEPANAFMIAVPTPFDENRSPDLKYIEAAAKTIAPVLEPGNLVVLESTSPVGATEKLADWLKQQRPDLSFPQDHSDQADIHIAHCPERVLPGHVLQELVSNDRVIGGMSKTCSQKAVQLYNVFVKGECVLTDSRTAEMAKLTENSFRDVNIAFANELSIICDKLEINVHELIELANRHPRVNILKPGPGVGGHCIAVDPWFIVDSAPDEAKLIRQARETNDFKPKYVVQKTLDAIEDAQHQTIACLGLTFKADIDDLRESPSLLIVENLARQTSAKLVAVEPNITKLPSHLMEAGVELLELNHALDMADIVLILVSHKQFKKVDKTRLQNKVVINTTSPI